MEAYVVAACVEQDKESVSLALRVADVEQEHLRVRIIPVAVGQDVAVRMVPGDMMDGIALTGEVSVIREPQRLEHLGRQAQPCYPADKLHEVAVL